MPNYQANCEHKTKLAQYQTCGTTKMERRQEEQRNWRAVLLDQQNRIMQQKERMKRDYNEITCNEVATVFVKEAPAHRTLW